MRKSNLDGQAMGKKGLETQQRLLDAAMEMLATTPLRDLRIGAIAKKAGISAGTYYLYFENVDALVLALSNHMGERATDVIDLVRADWPEAAGDEPIYRFVRAYFDFWDKYRPVLRIRNLAAEEGDWRFQESRLRVSAPLHEAIGDKVQQAMDAGLIPASLHKLTLAAVALASLERNAAGYLLFPRKFGVSRERLIDASVFMIKRVVLGLEAPAD